MASMQERLILPLTLREVMKSSKDEQEDSILKPARTNNLSTARIFQIINLFPVANSGRPTQYVGILGLLEENRILPSRHFGMA